MTDTINNVPRELKPCPFCGSAAKLTKRMMVVCSKGSCFASEAFCEQEQWNNRAPSPAAVDADHVEDVRAMVVPSIAAAYAMGAKGGTVVDAERLAFESWMAGHCWALCAAWDGSGYRCESEQAGQFNPAAGVTRRLWAAWRDRAALATVCAAAPNVVSTHHDDDDEYMPAGIVDGIMRSGTVDAVSMAAQSLRAQPAGEVPEVVAYLVPSAKMTNDGWEDGPTTSETADAVGAHVLSYYEPLMPIAQHTRIVAALQARAVVMPTSPYMPGVEPAQLSDYERGEAQGRCDMWEEVARINGKGGV